MQTNDQSGRGGRDGAKSDGWSTVAILAAIFCVFWILFQLRNSLLGQRHEIPDGWFWGYSASRLNELFEDWGQAGKQWYIATQLTLDVVFPLFYGWLFMAIFRCGFSASRKVAGHIAVAATCLADLTENIALVIIASKDGLVSDSPLSALASWSTVTKCALWLSIWLWFLIGGCIALYRSFRNGLLWSNLIFVVERFVRLRFPVLALTTLASWGFTAYQVDVLRPIASNTLLLESHWQLVLLGFVNSLAILFALATLRAVIHFIEVDVCKNVEYRTTKWKWEHFLLVYFLSLVTPLTAFHFSTGQGAFPGHVPAWDYAVSVLFISWGYFWALAIMYIFGWLSGILIGQEPGDSNFFPAQARQQKAMWLDLTRKQKSHFNIQMYFYFALLAILFFVVFNSYERHLTWLSIPVYLVMLVWLVFMIMTRLSLMLDSARMPTTLILVLIIVAARIFEAPPTLNAVRLPVQSPSALLVTQFRDVEQKYSAAVQRVLQAEAANKLQEMTDAESEAARLENEQRQIREQLEELAWNVVVKRMAKVTAKDQKKTLVIVTCPGGGIHAAAWSALVLERLDCLYQDFSQSLCLISGVSGGSVGTMFHAQSRYIDQTDGTVPLDGNQWKRAAQSSLGAIGAGLAFHDIPSAFIPWWYGLDRGQRLEFAWRERIGDQNQQQTLSQWGQKAQQGEMPAVVFNATDASSGRRVVFASVPLPPRPSLERRAGRPWDYRELLDINHDLHVASAARASATFPYVSPLSRPDQASSLGSEVALGDGGYADNEGIVTAIDWLDFIGRKAADQKKKGQEVPFQRILLLRIQPISDLEITSSSNSTFNKLLARLRWLTGPLEALATMRTSSQVERGQLEADLATTYIDTPWWTDSSKQTQPTLAAASSAKDDPDTPGTWVEQSRLNSSNVDLQLRVANTVAYEQQKQQSSDIPPLEVEPTPQVYVGDSSNSMDVPVIVGTIAFQHPAPEEPIPLNWRLSPRQVDWYPKAWNLIVNAAMVQEKQQDPAKLTVIQVLNKYLHLREKAKVEL